MNSIFYLEKTSLFFVKPFQQKYIIKSRNVLNFISSEWRWMKYFYSQFLYSHEGIVLTISKSLIIKDTLSSTVDWIPSENFKRQCLTQNVQSVLPRLLGMLILLCRGLAGISRKYNTASSKHLYIKTVASAHRGFNFLPVILWTFL